MRKIPSGRIPSGGVAFYCYDQGRVYFLVGQETNGEWDIFGGGAESKHGDRTVEDAAAREGHEETDGVFDLLNRFAPNRYQNYNPILGATAGIAFLRNRFNNNLICRTARSGATTYFVDVTDLVQRAGGRPQVINQMRRLLRELQRRRRNQRSVPYRYVEKTDFAWVDGRVFVNTITNDYQTVKQGINQARRNWVRRHRRKFNAGKVQSITNLQGVGPLRNLPVLILGNPVNCDLNQLFNQIRQQAPRRKQRQPRQPRQTRQPVIQPVQPQQPQAVGPRSRYVLVLDLNDDRIIRRSFPVLQGQLGGTPVQLPHVTLFGAMTYNQQNRQRIINAVNIALQRYRFNTPVRVNINQGIRRNNPAMQNVAPGGKLRTLVRDIDAQLRNQNVTYHGNNLMKPFNGYHMSLVYRPTNRVAQSPIHGDFHINRITLYTYDDNRRFTNPHQFTIFRQRQMIQPGRMQPQQQIMNQPPQMMQRPQRRMMMNQPQRMMMNQPPQMMQQPRMMNQPPQMMQQPRMMNQPPQMMQQPRIMNQPPQMMQQPRIMGQPPQMMQQPRIMGQPPQMMQQPRMMNQLPQTMQQPRIMGQPPQMMQQPRMMNQLPQTMQQPRIMGQPQQIRRRNN